LSAVCQNPKKQTKKLYLLTMQNPPDLNEQQASLPRMQRLSTKVMHSGFSLVELAIVLLIVALLTGGLLLGISGQRNVAENADAQRQLETIREALLGFAMANGRLPCSANPMIATTGGAGSEEWACSPVDCSTTDRVCSREFGSIPWNTLGLPETDPWNSRFTYFVGKEFANPITQTEKNNGVRTRFRLDTEGRANIEDGAGNRIASKIPAVIVSHGSRNFGAYQSPGNQIPGAAGDELENANSTLTFVSRTPGNDFDDLLIWVAPGVLMAKMVAAGRLP